MPSSLVLAKWFGAVPLTLFWILVSHADWYFYLQLFAVFWLWCSIWWQLSSRGKRWESHCICVCLFQGFVYITNYFIRFPVVFILGILGLACWVWLDGSLSNFSCFWRTSISLALTITTNWHVNSKLFSYLFSDIPYFFWTQTVFKE